MLFADKNVSDQTTSLPTTQNTMTTDQAIQAHPPQLGNGDNGFKEVPKKSKLNATTITEDTKQIIKQQKLDTVVHTLPMKENDSEPQTNQTTEDAASETEEKEAQPKQKKKTLGEKIDDFFGKFSKKQEPVDEETPETAPDSKTGERKSKRRGEEQTTTTETTDIKNLIEITDNAPSENWMLGIHGLKLTLTNHSNQRIETASVEVRYFDEDNNFLEKRTIQFNNISAKKSQTLAAPDHRLADHVEYRLLSVQSKQATGMKAF